MTLVTMLLLSILAGPFVLNGEDLTEFAGPQLWQRSDRYFHDGDYLSAIAIHERIISLDPTDVESYAVAAWLTWSLGDEPGGRRLLVRGVEANPDNWEANWELGWHLYDRMALFAEAWPFLERAATLPGHPPTAERTLAHCAYWGEQYAVALDLWRQMRERGGHPGGIIDLNEALARRAALRTDSMARSGGRVDQVDSLPNAPVVLEDRRFDWNADGFAEYRLLTLEHPDDVDGELDFAISYRGERAGNRTRWVWVQIAYDLNDDGRIGGDDIVYIDRDGDQLADLTVPIEVWRQRAAAADATTRWFAAPDILALGRDASGQETAADMSLAANGELAVRVPVVVETALRPLALRLVGIRTGSREAAWSLEAPLAPGSNPHFTVAPQTPAGSYWLAAELVVQGQVMQVRPVGSQVVHIGEQTIWLGEPTPWEVATRFLPAPDSMSEAEETAAPTPAAPAPGTEHGHDQGVP